MRDSWHAAWNDPSIPFLTCQLATFENPNEWGKVDWNTLRLQQAQCTQLPGVSMAILLDIGDRTDIHPLDKIPVAERLHALAMEDVYGVVCGAHEPKVVCCERDGAAILLRFDQPIELRSGELPEALSGNSAHACEAALVDDRTLCLSPETDAPITAVQYAAAGWFVPSLFGQNALPVAPFRVELDA